MVVALIGESCTGKSTLAEKIKAGRNATVYTGKDYLRMAKNEGEAARIFAALLAEKQASPETVVYVISEKEQLSLLPEGCVRIYCTAPLEVIRERFAARMHGQLPPPVARSLEAKHGRFEDGEYDLRLDASVQDAPDICAWLAGRDS